MKKVLLKLAFMLLVIPFVSTAQNFQGKAVYQTKTNLNIDFSNSQMPPDRLKRIKEMMKSQLEKTFTLTFDKKASIYKEDVKLDQPTGGGGFRIMFAGGSASGKLFKDIQNKSYSKALEFSGKNFLIKDQLTNYEWKMEQETKMIGENLCFKATAIIEVPERRQIQFGRRNNQDEDKNEEESEEEKMEQVIVTAWYTPSIPVSHGPSDYWGLPGLILEVSTDRDQIVCTKIILNPKNKIDLSEPSKGKEVSQKEYDKIIAEKMKEIRERFQGGQRRGGDRRGHTIRIGG